MSVSGRSAITTAAAWMPALRTIPSRPLRGVDDLARLGLGVVDAAQVGLLARYSSKRLRAAHHRLGDQLGQPVAGAVVEAEHARGVARGVARQHLAEGHDLGDRLAAVLVGHVPHHARRGP